MGRRSKRLSRFVVVVVPFFILSFSLFPSCHAWTSSSSSSVLERFANDVLDTVLMTQPERRQRKLSWGK